MNATPTSAPGDEPVDLLIAGGGQVGLALALALRRAAPTLSVMLVDAVPAGVRPREGRASTLTAGARLLLDQLGVWPKVAGDAQEVTAMIVTDSRTRDVARPVFLTFASDEGAMAHVVPDGIVVAALADAATDAGVRVVSPSRITDFTVGVTGVSARFADGITVGARLLVAADGVRSTLRDVAGITTIGHDYGQSGIVATVAHERPHNGQAEEHFLPGGPFAILPLKGNRSSLVWTEPTEVAATLVRGDPLVFRVELERRFGHRLGTFEVVDQPKAFPLALTLAREFVKPRFALVGDAAHSIHPIAGQGLNLGYRDVAALAETVVDAYRMGLDIGALSTLERYQRWRRYDTTEMALMTDGLNRLFANDNPLIRAVRDVGLGVVDRLPNLKRLFIDEAAGHGIATPPRLLRGQPI